MGQRANLFVLESERIELYYTHWGANRLDTDLFWGPATATAFARQQRCEAEGATLLDEVWAEGGAVIDHRTKTLLWFGGEAIVFEIPRRRLHLRLMRELWPGWTVRWASEGMADLAEYLGIELREVLVEGSDLPLEIPRLQEPVPENPWINMAITSQRDGRCEIFAVDAVGLSNVLLSGPGLLAEIGDGRGVSSFAWESHASEFPQSGIHVDWGSHELSYWFAVPETAIQSRVGALFPDWRTVSWDDRYEEQLQRVPGLTFPTPDERVLGRAVVKNLLEEDQDRSNMVPEILEALQEEPKGINPFALRDDVLSLPSDERRRTLRHHFPALTIWDPED